jgi:hypothetical protein
MRFIGIGGLILCLAFPKSGATSEAGKEGNKSRLDTLSPMLIQLGFAIKKQPGDDSVSPWEKDNFGLQRKRSLALKSRFPSNLGRDSFYRFWVDEEYFGTEIEAHHRLDSIYQMPPYFKGEREKVFSLRRGYRRGAKVFIFRTDVSAYSGKLEQLTEGCELLESVTGKPVRKNIVDSLKVEVRKPN